jgi:hypothetical protein
MTEEPRVCIDRVLSPDQAFEAGRLAVEENPENLPVAVVHPGLGVAPPSPLELALVAGKKWKVGRTLQVGYLDGEPEVQEKVTDIAREWNEHANVSFEFGSADGADIRISFQHPGSWSYLGTDAKTIPSNEPTMNYGWLTPTTPLQEYERVVRHEFGHALGCIHEHQNPSGDIPWDKEAVYRYYSGPPNNWSREQVDNNLFRKYSRDLTNFSDFDPGSIMLYPIPNAHTIGDYEVGSNSRLSDTDKAFISTMYPGAPKPVIDVDVDGTPVKQSIGAHGEQDVFRFPIETSGSYTVETEGPTDVVVSLLGPDDQTNLVGQDDDSGQGFNARITVQLIPGTYLCRVRHYRPTGTGDYQIAVTSASQ